MKEVEDQSQGRKLLTVVERIIADTDSLIALSQEHLRRAQQQKLDDELATIEAAALEVVRHFSNRTAITGGLAAAPALIPGAGTLLAAAGGTLADMGMVLKYEVEMALVLSHLYGFDITQDKERQLAFLMASVSTYNAKSGRNFFVDVAHAESIAIWKYAPREVSKMLVSVFTKIALMQLSKSLLRALPLVGIAVGSSMNKVLTGRVGERCMQDLKVRRQFAKEQAPAEEVVEAKVRKPKKKKKAS
ncbi:EcsC family protein [Hyalangium rubrum]|uniref:EcsC family protein n=1 Tax=Hyalangium rubrum TaxID=3103134 RepID=A0ABU5GW07_9BACT|nr:EcsC family protein [Hyalangium sp. s54d21]MDY7224742.1 EcsC family protein [Hyalangium sp. s54d21]